MPAAINGVPFLEWKGAPANEDGWSSCAAKPVEEPPYRCPPGFKSAAGAVILETDGRVWLVAPTNGFGGYEATFPKGRVDAGTSLQCGAMREAYEESGLQVEIVGYLADSRRTQTYTRYYLARRVDGNPACMGWETQAVHLVPLALLDRVACNPNDAAVIAALITATQASVKAG